MRERKPFIANVTIQLANPITPPSFGMPVYATTITVIQDGEQIVGQPVHTQSPMIPDDVTPELLASINQALATIGLKATQET